MLSPRRMSDHAADTIVDESVETASGSMHFTRDRDGVFEVRYVIPLVGIRTNAAGAEPPEKLVQRAVVEIQMTAMNALVQLTIDLLQHLPGIIDQPLPPLGNLPSIMPASAAPDVADWDGRTLVLRPQAVQGRLRASCPDASDPTMLQWLALNLLAMQRSSIRAEFGTKLGKVVGVTEPPSDNVGTESPNDRI